MELGIYTFAEMPPDPLTGNPEAAGKRLTQLMEEIELADQVGLDVFGVGEHHRPDFAVSAPAVVLAAAAARTKRIRLTSTVTVLSSDDPVRVYQQFATLDHLSGGRAEIMAGRGSFIESFPLFGFALKDYDALFEERLALLLEIRDNARVSWMGRHRAALNDQGVYPRAKAGSLPIWIAIGGTPESVVRAGVYRLPLAIAIIGGMPERFRPLVDLYHQALIEAHGAGAAGENAPPLGINAHGLIADTTEAATEAFYPGYAEVMTRIGRERGWPPTNRAQFDAGCGLRGALLVGSPQQIIDKILFQHEIFGNQRYLMQMSVGPMPQKALLRSIELFGTVVAPAVRKAVGKSR